jgi:chromosome segregation ATPase
MLEFGFRDVVIFFIISSTCIAFVAAWIIKSESKRRSVKTEINKLKSQLEKYEHEHFMLMETQGEAVSSSKDASGLKAQAGAGNNKVVEQLMEQNSFLTEENKRLTDELTEAKNSLEEIYKTLVDKG